MTEQEIVELLEKAGVVVKGHFILSSRRHSDTFVNKDALYTAPRHVSLIGREIAFRYSGMGIEAVVGPAIGAALLSQWVAFHMHYISGREIVAAYADKTDLGSFIFRRGYDRLIRGKRTLFVEDVMTTGGSVKYALAAGRAVGAVDVGVAALWNRGGVTSQMLGADLTSLVTREIPSWREDEVPEWLRAIPINVDLGHGKSR